MPSTNVSWEVLSGNPNDGSGVINALNNAARAVATLPNGEHTFAPSDGVEQASARAPLLTTGRGCWALEPLAMTPRRPADSQRLPTHHR